MVSSEDVIDNDEDNREIGSHSESTNSVFQQSLNSSYKKSVKNELDSNIVLKTNGNTFHSSEEYLKTTKTRLTENKTRKTSNKSNIANKRRKQSNNCSKYTDESVNKLNESTDEMTDPTTTQTIKTEIISNDETEEDLKFQYLSQNFNNFENTYNSLNLSESQLSTKEPNDEQNNDMIDIKVDYEECLEQTNFVDNQLEGPVFVDIKPSNSSTDPQIDSVFKCPISGCEECLTIDFIPKHSLEIHNQFVVICDQNKCKKVFTSSAKYEEHMTRLHPKVTHFIPDKNESINEELKGNECNKCDICGKVFHNKHLMRKHRRFIHILTPSIECDYPGCAKKFKQQNLLIIHKSTVHSMVDLKFECKECYKGFTSSAKYEEHMKRHQQKDSTNDGKCDICGKVFGDRKLMQKHRRYVHFLTPTLECDYPGCVMKFRYQCHLKRHKKDSHSSNEKFECDICGKVYRTIYGRNSHKKLMHINSPCLECDYPGCEKTFRFQKGLDFHKNAVHSSKRFECNQCSKVFILQKMLIRHMSFHSENKCDICGKVFDNKRLMNSHKRHNHMVIPSLVCDFPGCGRRFKFQSVLSDHKSTVHSSVDQTFECEQCNKKFRHQRGLRVHKRHTHSNKLLACNWPGCEFRSKYSYYIKIHQKSHRGERDYVCDWADCGKAFKVKGTLREHKKNHTRTDFLVCDWPGCQYKCTAKCRLTRHQTVHTSECKYVCDWPECGKALKSIYGLRLHMKIHTRDRLRLKTV